MRHGAPQVRRQRNRGGSSNGGGGSHGGGQRRSGGGGHSRTQVFDSNGKDVRIRGTAAQVCEKYLALAKDAAASGDRILAESYLQHAEHYQRIINSFDENVQQTREMRTSGGMAENDFSDDEGHGNGNTQEDDLSLPRSILGPVSQVKSQIEVGVD